jgi:YgiT-type zinc finger domain-containing protein
MKCHVCGSQMHSTTTTLPFKVSETSRETSIVILKKLPVLQCTNCSEYLMEDPVMARVEEILAAVDRVTELEVIQFAA